MLAAAMAGLFVLRSFLHDGIVGGDDAVWYTSVVADHVEQWRMGLGPVFVGQTRFAAIGTVMPLRVAPYLQHLTLAIDLLTGRTLAPYLLLNLAVAASGAAGGLSAYLCLRSILGSQRLEALLLAVLYIWCPGVIGLPISGQLFMSAMTMPFLPVVFTGVVRIYQRDSFTGWAMVSAGCAACWLAHSPIGMWASIAAGLAVLARWACGLGWKRRDLARAAGAALLFFGLCGYVFVSVAVLAPHRDEPMVAENLLGNIRLLFPAILLPVSHLAAGATDLQLGWSLSAALLLSVILAWGARAPAARALSLVGLILLCLILPVPFLTSWLWHRVPPAVVDATNALPNQRLVAILAACTVTLAATLLASRKRRRGWVLLFLGLGVAWSGWELREFIRRGRALENTKAQSDYAISPDMLLSPSFSLGMLVGHNSFFSHGFMDRDLEQRVLNETMVSYIVSNPGSISPGYDFGAKTGHGELPGLLTGTSLPGEKVWVSLSPTIVVPPHRHYVLVLSVPDRNRQGVLLLMAPNFYRRYNLPASGGPYAFGSTDLSSWMIPIHTGSELPVEITLAFTNEDLAIDMAHYRAFGRYQLIEYDPAALPIRLKSLVPYVAEVQSPAKGWYESFRYFTRGWAATVNGNAAEVRMTANGLVGVAIPAGKSEVRLSYRPPATLVASYWLMAATWAGLAVLCVGRWAKVSRLAPRS
jgi:hypothetical protein